MTTENPYQSPATPSPASCPGKGSPDGLWRDGKLLVVRIRDPQFPPRCVKTNEPYYGPPTCVKLRWFPNAVIWFLVAGIAGLIIGQELDGKSNWVALPISNAWLTRRRKLAFLGGLLVVIGILAVVGGSIGAIVMSAPRSSTVLWEWFISLSFGGLGAAIAGVLLLKPPVQAHKITNGLAWLKGVHPALLELVPDWPYRKVIIYVDE